MTTWRKSTYSSDSANCVEVATDRTVRIRDSKLADGSPVLSFSRQAWAEFVDGLKGSAKT
jgi:hypothetical protein